MAFQLDPKPDDMFFERKQPAHASSERSDDVHKDLFDTISEAHYLPELGGPHDEALLESLVEKGCEDNQILGQALDKLAHLVTDYEEEDDMLLDAAPVSDIITRLEQSLESPGASMTAAQGLLHLHQLSDHLSPQSNLSQHTEPPPYVPEGMFAPQPDQSALSVMHNNPQLESSEISHVQYEQNSSISLEDNHGYDQNTGTNVQYNQNSENSHVQYDQIAASRLSDESRLEDSHVTLEQDAESNLQNNVADNTDTVYLDISEKTTHHPNDHYDNTFEEQPPANNVLAQKDNTAASEGPNQETEAENCDTDNVEIKTEMGTEPETTVTIENVDFKDLEEVNGGVELVATDLSLNSLKPKQKNKTPLVIASVVETTGVVDSVSEKSEEFPRDLSVQRRLSTPHVSPRRTDVPRAPSRESDAMQSPQPSGIPAVPSSPEIFTVPHTKSKQTLFLESLLSSPSPKMYTSEVTITKQQCEPLNLGKHRKSASPTVSSCSDEIRKPSKDYGEPQDKRIKYESTEDLAKISKVFNKCSEEQIPDSAKQKKSDRPPQKPSEEVSPLRQLQNLNNNPDFNIPNPLLVPKNKLNHILEAPGREIPALLLQRPELRLPEAFAYPGVLQDPEILVISLSQLESILENDAKKQAALKTKENKAAAKTLSSTEHTSTPQVDATQPKPIPSMDALAGDIDAATSAALNQMLWLPYLSQLEAMAACSQNMDFLKALNSSGGYTGQNYPDVSQMFNPSAARGFMGPTGFPMMPPMDYDNRLQFAMWQEAMNHANATAAAQRAKPSTLETQMRDLAKSSDVQNPYVHSTKSHQSKSHSAARTSPIAHNYNTNQRAMPHNPYLQSMYPGMAPNMRPNMPLPGLQIPYFNPNLMSQRSPRTLQQKSPTSPYYQNNNYLPSKQPEGHQTHQRRSSTSSQESPRPRISVKSLQNLLEPSAAAATSSRRHSHGAHGSSGLSQGAASSLSRRRDEPEVGSTTTPLGEPMAPHHMPPHPHDPASFHLWHPLFGNQQSYTSPWSWTTVTATGD